jgi:hypothetical protein
MRRLTAVGFATATFAARLAKLPTISNVQGSQSPRFPPARQQDGHGRRDDHAINTERYEHRAPRRFTVPERELAHMTKADNRRDHREQGHADHRCQTEMQRVADTSLH